MAGGHPNVAHPTLIWQAVNHAVAAVLAIARAFAGLTSPQASPRAAKPKSTSLAKGEPTRHAW
eukprot:4666266-Prymnesium_polylepis.1